MDPEGDHLHARILRPRGLMFVRRSAHIRPMPLQNVASANSSRSAASADADPVRRRTHTAASPVRRPGRRRRRRPGTSGRARRVAFGLTGRNRRIRGAPPAGTRGAAGGGDQVAGSALTAAVSLSRTAAGRRSRCRDAETPEPLDPSALVHGPGVSGPPRPQRLSSNPRSTAGTGPSRASQRRPRDRQRRTRQSPKRRLILATRPPTEIPSRTA